MDGRKGSRTPHFLQGDGLVAAAGLAWSMELPDGERSRCVITCEARDASGAVRDRMPASLCPTTWNTWLTLEKLSGTTKVEILSMLEHTSSDVASTILEHIVDPKVNKSRVDPSDPTLLQAVP